MESSQDRLPIIEVTEQNFSEIYPFLIKSIQNCSFIAVDVEMSGLGDRKKLFYSEIDMRYTQMAQMARNYAVVSLGLSCYTFKECSGNTSQNYIVNTFNFLVLSQSPHTVHPESLKFLRSHGFDFNKLYQYGIPYKPGSDEVADVKSKNSMGTANSVVNNCMRDVFNCMVTSSKPLVFHNGFVDLVFLYQHFYTDLPKKLDTFVADLSSLFVAGIYDTKYFSEFVHRVPATYLQYVYLNQLLRNESLSEWRISLTFPDNCLSQTRFVRYHFVTTEDDHNKQICSSYAYHGWCEQTDKCHNSHNLRRIVKELTKSKKQRKNSNSTCAFKAMGTKALLQCHIKSNSQKNGTQQNRRNEEPLLCSSPSKCEEGFVEKKPQFGPFSSKRPKLGAPFIGPTPNGTAMKTPDVEVNVPSESNSIEDISGNENGDCDFISRSDSIEYLKSLRTSESSSLDDGAPSEDSCEGHSAGYDAFLTGFIFASFVSYEKKSNLGDFSASSLGFSDHVNKVYLMGKDIPLLIKINGFSKLSSNHSNKIKFLRM